MLHIPLGRSFFCRFTHSVSVYCLILKWISEILASHFLQHSLTHIFYASYIVSERCARESCEQQSNNNNGACESEAFAFELRKNNLKDIFSIFAMIIIFSSVSAQLGRKTFDLFSCICSFISSFFYICISAISMRLIIHFTYPQYKSNNNKSICGVVCCSIERNRISLPLLILFIGSCFIHSKILYQ